MTESPIIIVGAGRSGTKLLRSLLVSHPDVVSFPREINYIWRHGNIAFPTDELLPEHARPEVVAYIRKRFAQFGRRHPNCHLVEKTCANALRVGFVHAVFPEARIIHLIRDGRAVAESARNRWQARPDLRYLSEKARWLPLEDIPFYGLRYLRYQVGRIGSRDNAQSSWGPRFAGLDELVATRPLLEVCAVQWQECVRAARKATELLPASQSTTVRYEDLVRQPLPTAEMLFDRLGLSFSPASRHFAQTAIHEGNLEKWKQVLSPSEQTLIEQAVGDELLECGYVP